MAGRERPARTINNILRAQCPNHQPVQAGVLTNLAPADIHDSQALFDHKTGQDLAGEGRFNL
jgi:hypothetical protein